MVKNRYWSYDFEVTEDPDAGKYKEYVNRNILSRPVSQRLTISYSTGVIATFYAPDDEGFRTNINILVDRTGAHYTLEEYADLAIDEMSITLRIMSRWIWMNLKQRT